MIWFYSCIPRTVDMGTISTRVIYLWIIAHIFSLIPRILLFYYSVPLYSVTKKRERSSELPNFMDFIVIVIDDIVFENKARCPHKNRAPIHGRCYDKRIYSLYLCRAKHLVTELSIFWSGNGVEVMIFVYPVKFSWFFSSFEIRLFSIMFQ